MSTTLGAPSGGVGSGGHHGSESRQSFPIFPWNSFVPRAMLPSSSVWRELGTPSVPRGHVSVRTLSGWARVIPVGALRRKEPHSGTQVFAPAVIRRTSQEAGAVRDDRVDGDREVPQEGRYGAGARSRAGRPAPAASSISSWMSVPWVTATTMRASSSMGRRRHPCLAFQCLREEDGEVRSHAPHVRDEERRCRRAPDGVEGELHGDQRPLAVDAWRARPVRPSGSSPSRRSPAAMARRIHCWCPAQCGIQEGREQSVLVGELE